MTSKNNDSNKVELDFAYPKIDKIESKNGFLADSKIYIHWKNLWDFDMFVNDTKTTDFIENSQWVIEYTLPNKLEDIDIKFEKYNLTSNEITIKIQYE